MSTAAVAAPVTRRIGFGASLRRNRRWALITSYAFLVIFAIFFLLPPYYMIVTSLKSDADRFMDVDATPVVVGENVYASSSSGGVYALDKTTGLIRWRVPFWDAALPSSTGNVGGIATDGKTLYVSVADLGTYAIDLAGNVLWRVGAKEGGEPAAPVIWNELLVYSLAHDGMFIADRRTGETLEYFDPGDGTSSSPTITGDGRLFVMSNRGILYAFDIE